jgi:ribosome maturation protein SDO1
MANGKRLREQVLEGAETVEDDEIGQDEWEVVSLALNCLLH